MAQYFYDAQVRRYLTQTIRVLSNFVVRYSDGSLVRVPVTYGDPDRQVANIIAQNTENIVNACPRIAVYITGLDIDRERLADSTFVGKLHIRERDIVDNQYTYGKGRNYTVERLMPTPFRLTMKADIWSANTDQKLQLLEQISVFFNPSLELQTTDNYIDWTSLSVLNLVSINWSSRSVPVGSSSPIDIATLTLETPIWISPPAKVKHLGVITSIITSIYQTGSSSEDNYIDGLGLPLISGSDTVLSNMLSTDVVTITDYHIQVYNNAQGVGQAVLLGSSESCLPREVTLEIPIRQGTPINWSEVFAAYPEKYKPGSSTIFLKQPNGTQVVGTVVIDPFDDTILSVTWDQDTLTTNTGIDSQGRLDTDTGYNASDSFRPSSPGTFDAIINPQTTGPDDSKLPEKSAGRRYLLVDDIGADINVDGADAWKGTDGSDLIANANDIIEWSGTRWVVIFDSNQESDTMLWQTNIYTGVQYVWNGIQWAKSFEGEYKVGSWKIEL